MQKKEIICNGIRISYQEKITDENAPLTIFLHGWMSSKESFHQLFSEYKNIIALDFPEMGESQGFSKEANLEDFANIFHEFLRKKVFISIHQKKKYEIIVHSFGGRVLLKWLDIQKNTEYVLNSMVFIGVPFYRNISSTGKIQNFIGRILQYKIFSWIKPFIKKIYSMCSLQKNISDYSALSNETLKKTFQNIVSEEVSQYLHHLKDKNVKFIWGENDDSAPIYNMITAKKIVPNAKSYTIKNAKHFPWVDNLTEFLIALRK